MTDVSLQSPSVSSMTKTPMSSTKTAYLARLVHHLRYMLGVSDHPDTAKWNVAGERVVRAALLDNDDA